MAAIRDKGVNFANPHSLFPTFTMANASAMATGHYLGDTGDFSNTIYAGFPSGMPPAASRRSSKTTRCWATSTSISPATSRRGRPSCCRRAHQGFTTAAIGKLGPTLIFDHTDRTRRAHHHRRRRDRHAAGVPLSQDMQDALTAAGLPLPRRRAATTARPATAKKPGTTVANVEQQKYFADVATKVVLPMFKARNKPFVLVFWSRDPDGTQHNQGDSL